MCKSRNHLLVLSTTLALLCIAFVCDAQTIRSQRKLGLLDGMSGVVTSIGGTRVTIAFEETGENLTVHVRDASDLEVGDTVKMEAGRPVKLDMPVKVDTPAEPPKQAGAQKVEEPPPTPAKPAPHSQAGTPEPSKPNPNAQK